MFCPTCGTENQIQAEECIHCGAPLKPEIPGKANTPKPIQGEASTQQTISKERAVAGNRVARLGDRLLAVILDGILVMAVYAVLGSAVASRWGGMTQSGFSMTGTPALISMGLTAAFFFIYYWFFEGLLGATLGKLMLGIKVKDLSGGPCSLSQSFLRNLLRIIDGIALYLVGFLIAIFSKLRQRLGDHVAKTVVVELKPGTAVRVIIVLIWLAAIGSSAWGAYVIFKDTKAVSPAAINSPAVRKPSDSPPLQTGITKTGGQLQVVDFQFTEGEKGPIRAAVLFKPKDRVFSQYHIIGYTKDDQGQINLKGQVTVSDPGNVTAFKGDFTIKEQITGNDPARGWVNFTILNYSPPGSYKINIKIHDTLNNTDAEYMAPFIVDAPPVIAAKELELRELQLSLTEEGPPLSTPIIPLGGKAYTAAKLAGMQFKDNNAHVKIAFKLFGPRGELILNKPDFLEIKDSWDYRPNGFFIPITANISPPSGRKGLFTEQFQVTDMYGNSTRTFSAKFEVR